LTFANIYRISSYSFRGFRNPKVTVHKLFKGGNYMRKYGTYLLTSCLGSKSKWKMSKIGHTFGKKVSKIEGIKTFLSKNAPLNYYCLKKQTKKTLSGQLGSILNSFTNI
jgi:hypothetical protein